MRKEGIERERQVQKPWVIGRQKASGPGGQGPGWGICQGFERQCHAVGREQRALKMDTSMLKIYSSSTLGGYATL